MDRDNQRDNQSNKVISKVDLDKISHQLVMTGFVAMVEDDGMTLHEAMETVREIQRVSTPAIMQIMSERRAASGKE